MLRHVSEVGQADVPQSIGKLVLRFCTILSVPCFFSSKFSAVKFCTRGVLAHAKQYRCQQCILQVDHCQVSPHISKAIISMLSSSIKPIKLFRQCIDVHSSHLLQRHHIVQVPGALQALQNGSLRRHVAGQNPQGPLHVVLIFEELDGLLNIVSVCGRGLQDAVYCRLPLTLE